MTEALDLAAEAEFAATKHVVVIGGGISGLVSALEVAKLGVRVTVVEASDRLGGVIRTAELAGIAIDTGTESYATRGGHVRSLLDELGLADRIVRPNPAGAWLVFDGDAAPLPKGTLLGIPTNAFAPDVQRIIGKRASWRAYADRLLPVLTIGRETSLGELVRKRMGQRVLDRLVTPITAGVYSADPMHIDTDVAAPGLNGAYTRAGSLSGGVAQLQASNTRNVDPKKPGSAIEGIDGGIFTIVEALIARLQTLGVTLKTGTTVTSIEDAPGGEWRVVTQAPAEAPAGAQTEAQGEEELAPADAVIVAVDEQTARTLLAPHVAGLGQDAPEAPRIELITLVIDDERLDEHPRGTGVLTAAGAAKAKALTHSSAKWPWLQARIHTPHRHVVRVSFGTVGEAPVTEDLSDAEAAELARTEAGGLLGLEIPRAAVQASHRERFIGAQPAAQLGAAASRRSAREHINKTPTLAAVGAWQAGTGLAQVIPDAKVEAECIRRHVLFASNET